MTTNRTCQVCAITDDTWAARYARTRVPGWWITDDLCSYCAGPAHLKLSNQRRELIDCLETALEYLESDDRERVRELVSKGRALIQSIQHEHAVGPARETT